jgi:hypothetical protein
MSKVFVMLLMVLGIWGAAELMWKGPDQAFGGVLVDLGLADALRKSDGTPIQSKNAGVKAADRYRSAYDTGIDRAERALTEDQ